jgi:trehalose/maltose hydrolase-like predicted phosphorylase
VVQILCGIQEHHISAAVAYAVWQYWQATRDVRFLLTAGAEILLETARFWASRAALEGDGAYHIRKVIGPDEYHESVDDNAYTNRMAAWNLERGLMITALLRARWPVRWTELSRKLDLDESELERWRDVTLKLVTGFDPVTGLYEQFKGFFGLEDVDLRGYAVRGVPPDLVLGPDKTRRSQVIKQADVLMLLFLLRDSYSRSVIEANFRYYEPRTGHGSSLSPGIHAALAGRLGDADLVERYLAQTMAIDLDDRMGNAAGGIHMAAQGSLWQAAVFGCAGVEWRDDAMVVAPWLPPSWQGVECSIQWRGRTLQISVDAETDVTEIQLIDGQPLVNRTAAGADQTLDAGDSRRESTAFHWELREKVGE